MTEAPTYEITITMTEDEARMMEAVARAFSIALTGHDLTRRLFHDQDYTDRMTMDEALDLTKRRMDENGLF